MKKDKNLKITNIENADEEKYTNEKLLADLEEIINSAGDDNPFDDVKAPNPYEVLTQNQIDSENELFVDQFKELSMDDLWHVQSKIEKSVYTRKMRVIEDSLYIKNSEEDLELIKRHLGYLATSTGEKWYMDKYGRFPRS